MTAARRLSTVDIFGQTVTAGRMLPWPINELIPPPTRQRRSLVGILGPGILLAGGATGTGEWQGGLVATGLFFLAITLVAASTI